jgi:hypothetical protein
MMQITCLPDRAQGPLSAIATTVYSYLKAAGAVDTNTVLKALGYAYSDTLLAIEELRGLNAISMQRVEQQLAA